MDDNVTSLLLRAMAASKVHGYERIVTHPPWKYVMIEVGLDDQFEAICVAFFTHEWAAEAARTLCVLENL